MNRCQIVMNISNLTVGVKHSIRRRTMLSPNLHSVEAETLEETTATIEKKSNFHFPRKQSMILQLDSNPEPLSS